MTCALHIPKISLIDASNTGIPTIPAILEEKTPPFYSTGIKLFLDAAQRRNSADWNRSVFYFLSNHHYAMEEIFQNWDKLFAADGGRIISGFLMASCPSKLVAEQCIKKLTELLAQHSAKSSDLTEPPPLDSSKQREIKMLLGFLAANSPEELIHWLKLNQKQLSLAPNSFYYDWGVRSLIEELLARQTRCSEECFEFLRSLFFKPNELLRQRGEELYYKTAAVICEGRQDTANQVLNKIRFNHSVEDYSDIQNDGVFALYHTILKKSGFVSDVLVRYALLRSLRYQVGRRDLPDVENIRRVAQLFAELIEHNRNAPRQPFWQKIMTPPHTFNSGDETALTEADDFGQGTRRITELERIFLETVFLAQEYIIDPKVVSDKNFLLKYDKLVLDLTYRSVEQINALAPLFEKLPPFPDRAVSELLEQHVYKTNPLRVAFLACLTKNATILQSCSGLGLVKTESWGNLLAKLRNFPNKTAMGFFCRQNARDLYANIGNNEISNMVINCLSDHEETYIRPAFKGSNHSNWRLMITKMNELVAQNVFTRDELAMGIKDLIQQSPVLKNLPDDTDSFPFLYFTYIENKFLAQHGNHKSFPLNHAKLE